MRSRMTIVSVALLAGLVGLSTLIGTMVALAAGAPTIERISEPVIVRQIFHGVPVDEICAYRLTNSQFEVIPVQVDERNGEGAIVTLEDGILDGNDEIVFMAADLGEKANASIASSIPISPVWYRIQVEDPLSSAQGWAYVVRGSSASCAPPRDYVNFSGADRRVIAQDYTVGWAESHAGLDRMTLFGGANILDRTKLRGRAGAIAITEDSQLLQPTPPLELIKDGPVRVIVNRGAAHTVAYASKYLQTTPVPLHLVPGTTTVNEIRVSFDLVPGTNGVYYDENVGGGVTIDGVPDAVPTTPLNQAWRQTSLPTGSIIEVVELSEVTGTLQHYYQDQVNCGAADTGDDQCWGDSGFSVINPQKTSIIITGTQYILVGGSPNQGAAYLSYATNPLTVKTTQESLYSSNLFLPSLAR